MNLSKNWLCFYILYTGSGVSSYFEMPFVLQASLKAHEWKLQKKELIEKVWTFGKSATYGKVLWSVLLWGDTVPNMYRILYFSFCFFCAFKYLEGVDEKEKGEPSLKPAAFDNKTE